MKQPSAYGRPTQRLKTAPLYTKGEEIFNAVSHIAGGALGLIFWIVLTVYAAPVAGYTAAVSAFGISVILLYTMSALYHFLPVGTGKKVFRIFDHCTIFLLIAGTYTPYCVIALNSSAAGVAILATEWTLATLGIIGNAIAMNNKIIKGLSMALYFIMGWLILVACKELLSAIPFSSFLLLLAGGIAYTLGIVFYAFGKKVRYFHSVWHLFDIAGTLLQFSSILIILL